MMQDSPRLRVLVVDDEPLLRWSIAEALKAAGHLVSEAGSARETAALLSQEPAPDVVLLDYCLPDSDNLNLLGAIKSLVPASQIIMITAHASDDMAFNARKLGAYRVVNKPLDMNDVVDLVQRAHAARLP